MSISFNTTAHYVSSDDFVRVNPWFTVTLEDRFATFIHSTRFERRVRAIQSDNFPDLFSQHTQSNPIFRQMFEVYQRRLATAADDQVARINRAADDQVKNLVNNADNFEHLRSTIRDAASVRTDIFLKNAEQQRNERLTALEKNTASVQRGQWLTFFGGAVVGGVAAALSMFCNK